MPVSTVRGELSDCLRPPIDEQHQLAGAASIRACQGGPKRRRRRRTARPLREEAQPGQRAQDSIQRALVQTGRRSQISGRAWTVDKPVRDFVLGDDMPGLRRVCGHPNPEDLRGAEEAGVPAAPVSETGTLAPTMRTSSTVVRKAVFAGPVLRGVSWLLITISSARGTGHPAGPNLRSARPREKLGNPYTLRLPFLGSRGRRLESRVARSIAEGPWSRWGGGRPCSGSTDRTAPQSTALDGTVTPDRRFRPRAIRGTPEGAGLVHPVFLARIGQVRQTGLDAMGPIAPSPPGGDRIRVALAVPRYRLRRGRGRRARSASPGYRAPRVAAAGTTKPPL